MNPTAVLAHSDEHFFRIRQSHAVEIKFLDKNWPKGTQGRSERRSWETWRTQKWYQRKKKKKTVNSSVRLAKTQIASISSWGNEGQVSQSMLFTMNYEGSSSRQGGLGRLTCHFLFVKHTFHLRQVQSNGVPTLRSMSNSDQKWRFKVTLSSG